MTAGFGGVHGHDKRRTGRNTQVDTCVSDQPVVDVDYIERAL